VTRLLDRYVLGIFLPALAMFTMTLLFLFVAVDFASKLGKFLELRDVSLLQFVIKFYLYRIPMLLMILIPSVLLFAPTFTIIKLARANEILPIAAAGISLRRMSLSFVVAAILSAAAMAVLEEIILPEVGDKISETEDIFSVRNVKYNIEDYDGITKLYAKEFTVESLLLKGAVRITQLNEQKQPVEIVTAEECRWDLKRKRWVAFNGAVEWPFELMYPPGEKPQTKKLQIPAEGYVIETKLKPETLRRSSGLSSRFSFMPLKPLIQDARRFPHDPSKALRVQARFAFPLSPVVLVLLGVPMVMDPNSKSFIKGLIFCFLLAVGYYLVHFACVDLGSRGGMPPVLAAWFPVGSFGLAGLFSFSRMRT